MSTQAAAKVRAKPPRAKPKPSRNNETDHASFSVEVFANEKKSPKEVETVLKSVFFTTYLVSE